MSERIDKILANSGYGTRKDIKKLIREGLIIVDGKLVKDAGMHVKPEEQVIEIEGEILNYKKFVYLMLNKPQGYISSTEDERFGTVLELIPPEYYIKNIFPVGRLDKDTVGLLLITNDGQLAHRLLSPKKHVPKKYIADIDSVVTQKDIESFMEGITLDDGYVTLPANLKILEIDNNLNNSKVEIEIFEGKYHQIKRMFEALNKKVIFLKRISMGPLSLDESLALGDVRELTEKEKEALFNW